MGFPFHLDRRRGSPSLLRCLGHDEGEMIRLPSGNFAWNPAATSVLDANEDGLIGEHQSVLIDRHVRRREDLEHPRHRPRRVDVKAEQASVGLIGEYDLGVKGADRTQVGGIQGRAGGLASGVVTGL
jgi:hypothetical protein